MAEAGRGWQRVCSREEKIGILDPKFGVAASIDQNGRFGLCAMVVRLFGSQRRLVPW